MNIPEHPPSASHSETQGQPQLHQPFIHPLPFVQPHMSLMPRRVYVGRIGPGEWSVGTCVAIYRTVADGTAGLDAQKADLEEVGGTFIQSSLPC